jgi:hypothetical protein
LGFHFIFPHLVWEKCVVGAVLPLGQKDDAEQERGKGIKVLGGFPQERGVHIQKRSVPLSLIFSSGGFCCARTVPQVVKVRSLFLVEHRFDAGLAQVDSSVWCYKVNSVMLCCILESVFPVFPMRLFSSFFS